VRGVDVLVVGAGPAGLAVAVYLVCLAVAARLAVSGVGRVEALGRELGAGGGPWHCERSGFGIWLRPLTAPAYARLLAVAFEGARA